MTRAGTAFVRFAGVPRPVAFVGCSHLVDRVRAALAGWPTEMVVDPSAAPMVTVRGEVNGYTIETAFHEERFREATDVGAVCTFVVDLVSAAMEATPHRLCLHCASVEIGGRLVVMPAASRTGKSTLAARLAAAGCRVFGDDLLPLSDDGAWGIAAGVKLRLRLPLPASASSSMRQFVRHYTGLSDHRYAYLDLPPALHAPHGTSAPLGAIVVLDRTATGRAGLDSVSRSVGLRLLIRQRTAGPGSAMAIVDGLHRLLEGLPCARLRYSDLDEAAEALLHAFADWERLDLPPGRTDGAGAAADNTDRPHVVRRPLAASDSDRYLRAEGVALRELDGELFLAADDDQAIFHLNAVGAGVWRLLQEPLSVGDIAAVLSAAFRNIDPARIERDVASLVNDLRRNGLVRPAR